jgi:hypothetical protein
MPQPTEEQIQIDFINSVYHASDPEATHKAVLDKLLELLDAEKSNAVTDAN